MMICVETVDLATTGFFDGDGGTRLRARAVRERERQGGVRSRRARKSCISAQNPNEGRERDGMAYQHTHFACVLKKRVGLWWGVRRK